MLELRVLAIVTALVVAAVVNVFLAPQIYSPRPPVFTGPDLAANEAWRGHAFSAQAWWLAEMLPESSFRHLKFDVLPEPGGHAAPIGIDLSDRAIEIFDMRVDRSEYPLDLEPLDVRSEIAPHIQHFAGVRCQFRHTPSARKVCDYFVAWDLASTHEPKTFVGVSTSSTPGAEEVGLIEVTLLERILGSSINSVPTIAEVSP